MDTATSSSRIGKSPNLVLFVRALVGWYQCCSCSTQHGPTRLAVAPAVLLWRCLCALGARQHDRPRFSCSVAQLPNWRAVHRASSPALATAVRGTAARKGARMQQFEHWKTNGPSFVTTSCRKGPAISDVGFIWSTFLFGPGAESEAAFCMELQSVIP